jgi:predicted DNA-binding transcriptional regulator AlpA
MLRTEKEIAERIRKSLSWLQHMRQTGEGPPYLKLGNSVRYEDEEVDAWLARQKRTRVWEFDGNDTFEPIGDAATRAVDKLRRRS